MGLTAPTTPALPEPERARTPATGYVTRPEQADARTPRAGRGQLGRRAGAVAARLLRTGDDTHATTDPDVVLAAYRDVLRDRPLTTTDNAARIKVTTAAAAYLTWAAPRVGTWLGHRWWQEQPAQAGEPLLVFTTQDLVWADVLLVGAARFPAAVAVTAAAALRSHIDASGDRPPLAGVRAVATWNPGHSLWVPTAEPTTALPLPADAPDQLEAIHRAA